ncbi:hypothetical protein [Nocardia sp. NPDC003345]
MPLAETHCHCRNEPWIHTGMLRNMSTPGRYRCPETLHCLHGTTIGGGRIAEHWRNVPGECPWAGLRVTGRAVCGCGRGPWITLRYLRIVVRRNLTGPVSAIACPGLCSGPDITVLDDLILDHPRDSRTSCPWSGTRIVPIGTPPPLFGRPEPPSGGPHR